MELPEGLIRPGRLTIRNVAAACLQAAGASGAPGIAEAAGELALPAARGVCLVLVDGLGSRLLAARSGHFPFLRSQRPETRELTSIVPSTTSAALTSLGTGRHPGETGLLGYTLYDAEGGVLLNSLQWDEGLRPMATWQQCPTLASQLEDPSRFTAIGPRKFQGSGLTEAAFGRSRALSAEPLDDRVDLAVKELRAGSSDLVYLHWGNLDHAGHCYGWNSWEWGDEAEALDSQLERLRRQLPADSLLVITADHGMVDVQWRADVAETPALRAGVDLITGEPRAMHLHTSQPQGVLERWSNYLGERAWVLSREQAIATVFPALRPRFVSSIGDVVVFMRGQNAVVDSRTQTPASLGLIGVHGSLTEDEMLIPLVVA